MPQNWYTPDPMNQGGTGGNVRANGGGGTQVIGFRSLLDAKRAMQGNQIPSAQYPDGYLGTIIDRRQDRLLQKVKNKLTDKSYQRGVHKGERVDPRDYYWSGDVDPQAGIRAQMKGQRWTAIGSLPEERLAHMGKVDALSPQEMATMYRKFGVDPSLRDLTVDTERSSRLASLRPNWR